MKNRVVSGLIARSQLMRLWKKPARTTMYSSSISRSSSATGVAASAEKPTLSA